MAESEWKAPGFGGPTWIEIPAADVQRAKAFYDAVFAWTWKPNSDGYKDDELVQFDLAAKGVALTGGILKSGTAHTDNSSKKTAEDDKPAATGGHGRGRGGIALHWRVEDIDKISEVIEKAGGRIISDKEKEGSFGVFRYFEDTEGNVGSVFQILV